MYEFYRTSLIGRSLLETIDSKIKENIITPEQAQFILSKFDETIPQVFNASVNNSLNFKGNILSYNFVDGVWKFVTKDFVMSINNKYFRSDYVKIVACDADTSMDGGRKRRRKA
ncbi:transcription initiation factor TFIIA small subunit [Pancytospora epiphaga]|nr:transcription initiation factor TFIIA small subunit [Pancytospora epiphaga]